MHFPLLLAFTALPLLASSTPEPSLYSRATTITIDTSKTYQEIDGFGFSEAFQRANLIVNLPAPKQKSLLDLLFNTTSGAGFSILRIGIGSSLASDKDFMNTIEPKSPGSPSATPTYVWDGKDSGQVFVAQQAASYGNNGGYLCGVSGETCKSGDWRQAFADYLIQWSKYYAGVGVNITHLGFLNEPENAASYASMLSNGQQAADFVKILRPALDAANMSSVGITCCDSEGWGTQGSLLAGLKSAGAESLLGANGLITSHTYTGALGAPFATTHKTWQTEYSDLDGTWTTAWYSSGGAGEGMTWASQIHTALTSSNCSAYLYWVATQGGNTNEKMVLVDATSYTVSKRLWAFAQYSRYIRPGAIRVAATGSGLQCSAFVNLDGSLVVPCLNTGTGAVSASLGFKGINGTSVTAWVTSNTQEMVSQAANLGSDGSVSGSVGARSLVTFVLTK
ncbi:glycoside hydrolase family 30 protein [Hyaloscypha variabilis]